jgi:multisubunit Na+/H+ antiporter MnhG subunit
MNDIALTIGIIGGLLGIAAHEWGYGYWIVVAAVIVGLAFLLAMVAAVLEGMAIAGEDAERE